MENNIINLSNINKIQFPLLAEYLNQLDQELKQADRLGVKPVQIGDTQFDHIINEGTVKWILTLQNELLFIPKYVKKEEIYHSIINRGNPVFSAGEAEIVGNNGDYILLNINNYSGHYQPSAASLKLTLFVLNAQGIDISQTQINEV